MKKRIKNCFILLLSIILVMSACPSVLMASAAVTSTGFTCDFEDDFLSEGLVATSDVMKRLGWNGASGNIGTIAVDPEHGKCLALKGGNLSGTGFDLGKGINSGIIKVRFSYKPTSEHQGYYVTLSNTSGGYDYQTAGAATTDRSYLTTIGTVVKPSTTGYKTDPTHFASDDTLSADNGKWHNIEYKIDMDNKTFTCSVDGTPLKNTYGIKHTSNASVGSLFFHLDDVEGFYIDDIVVEHDEESVPSELGFTCDFEDEGLASGTKVTKSVMKQLGWNGARSNDDNSDTVEVGTIENDSAHGNYLRWDKGVHAGFNLGDGITSGIVKISFLFKSGNESLENYATLTNKKDAYDYTGAGSGLVDRSYLSTIGNTIKPCVSGNKTAPATDFSSTDTLSAADGWHKIGYVIDMDSKKFTCYVDGVASQTYPIKHSSNGSVGSFYFHRDIGGALYFDDFVVTYEKTGSNASDNFALSDLKIVKDGTEITAPVSNGDVINVTVKAWNTVGTKKVTLVYASYNGNKLVDVKLLPVNIPTGIQEIESAPYTVKAEAVTETRAFIWDNDADLTPLATSVKYSK